MTRLNLLLLVALMLSSIYLVRVSHETRRLFAALDTAQNEAHALDNEYARLKSDKQTQATPLRVEKTARDKLSMRTATPAVTRYLSVAAAPADEASAATSAVSGAAASTPGEAR